MSKIVTDNEGGSPLKKPRGSKPGVARGAYRPRYTAPVITGLPEGWMEPDKHDDQNKEKYCPGCKFSWELTYFTPSPRGRLGVKARCKSCLAAAAVEYASTKAGKAARARAQAKFRAAEKALERQDQERREHLERMTQSPAGRAFLAKFGLVKQAEEMLSLANFSAGRNEIGYLKSGPSGDKA